MKRFILLLSLLALPLHAATVWYVNTNFGPWSMTTNLPPALQMSWGWKWSPTEAEYQAAGWRTNDFYQQPASNYFLLNPWFSNSAAGCVGVWFSNSVNQSSNIVSQWTPQTLTNAILYRQLLNTYAPGSYTNAQTTDAATIQWVLGGCGTNVAFVNSATNVFKMIEALRLGSTLVGVAGNAGPTPATFDWVLLDAVLTNGVIK